MMEVMLGFRTAGKSGPLDLKTAFHATRSAGYCVAYETLLEGARANLMSRTNYVVVTGGFEQGHSVVYLRQFAVKLITTPQGSS